MSLKALNGLKECNFETDLITDKGIVLKGAKQSYEHKSKLGKIAFRYKTYASGKGDIDIMKVFGKVTDEMGKLEQPKKDPTASKDKQYTIEVQDFRKHHHKSKNPDFKSQIAGNSEYEVIYERPKNYKGAFFTGLPEALGQHDSSIESNPDYKVLYERPKKNKGVSLKGLSETAGHDDSSIYKTKHSKIKNKLESAFSKFRKN